MVLPNSRHKHRSPEVFEGHAAQILTYGLSIVPLRIGIVTLLLWRILLRIAIVVLLRLLVLPAVAIVVLRLWRVLPLIGIVTLLLRRILLRIAIVVLLRLLVLPSIAIVVLRLWRVLPLIGIVALLLWRVLPLIRAVVLRRRLILLLVGIAVRIRDPSTTPIVCAVAAGLRRRGRSVRIGWIVSAVGVVDVAGSVRVPTRSAITQVKASIVISVIGRPSVRTGSDVAAAIVARAARVSAGACEVQSPGVTTSARKTARCVIAAPTGKALTAVVTD